MEATQSPRAGTGSSPPDTAKRTELILDALKTAIADSTEHRLFRSGKLAGLFSSRTGLPATAALHALSEGLLETVRTETKGKLLIEWVRPTARAMDYVANHDSPKAVLRELREVLGATREAVPAWMSEAKDHAARLTVGFERQAEAMLQRLDALTERVEAALRRAETTNPRLPEPVTELVPWAMQTLTFLDRHRAATGSASCSLHELFHTLLKDQPELTVPAFHLGLRRLQDARLVKLVPGTADDADPEFAMILDAEVCTRVLR